MQRAHIKDYRSIRDAKVEFKPGLNIIIGANGSGKTNFVRVAKNAISGAHANQLGSDNKFVFSGQHSVEIKIFREAKRDKYNDTITSLLDINKWLTTVEIDGLQFKGEDFHKSWVGVNYKRAVKGFGNKIVRPDSPILINHGVPLDYKLVSEPMNLSIEPNLSGMPDIKNQFVRVVIDGIFLSLLFLNKYEIVNLVEHADDKAVKHLVDKVINFNLIRIKTNLTKFSPINDVRLVDSARVYINTLQNEVIVQGLVLEFSIDGKWLPFNAMSSGTQRLFYIISEILSPISFYLIKDSKEGFLLKESTQTILLEEPELGIHPDQLYKLLLFLREQSEKHQIIITTHSPQVLDMLTSDELDRITICELDEKKGTQFRKLTKKKIATAQKFMKDVGYLSDFWLYSSLEEKGPFAS